MSGHDTVHDVLAAFIADFRAAGGTDPRPYLDRVEGADRDELDALIDEFLFSEPRRAWDPAAFAGSPEERLSDRIEDALRVPGGLWPELLPSLRERAQLKRAELVARLAAALGVAGREEKVASYYHEMEQGTLPSAGVSDRVLDALAGIVGESAQRLREAGRAFVPGGGEAGAAMAFTRVARPQMDLLPEGVELSPAVAAGPPPEHDEIDALFLDGP